jgi:hypothetical protein
MSLHTAQRELSPPHHRRFIIADLDANVANLDADESQTIEAHLGAEIAKQIEMRTGRRIRRLDVDVSPSGIIVRGLAPSYYVKQLALSAVLEVLAKAAGKAMNDEIQVTPAYRRE